MESDKEKILYTCFNQDNTLFCVGTNEGFRIYGSLPFKDSAKRELGYGVSILAVLDRTNIIGFVGDGSSSKYDKNTLILYDDATRKIITEIYRSFEIKNVKLKRSKIFIIGENEIDIFTYGNFQNIDNIKTYANKNGIFGLSLAPQTNIIVYPHEEKGQVGIKNYDEEDSNGNYITFNIAVHNTEITALAMNKEGNLFASASEKGTVIRISNIVNKSIIKELRVGTESVIIHSLSFSPSSTYLVCASNKHTIHIFNTEKENTKSVFGNIVSKFGIKSEYLNSEWSFAQFKIKEDCKKIAVFSPDDKPEIIIITSEGQYYLVKFNPDEGGECQQVLKNGNFLKFKSDKDDD